VYYLPLGKMGLGTSSFAVRQKVGVWGEATFLHYFKHHPEHGLSVLEYGDATKGKTKARGEAVNRPDLLIIETEELKAIAASGIHVNSDTDLRQLSDDSPILRAIVDHSLAAVEVKFSHRRYVKGHVKFIIDEGRRARYQAWLNATQKVGALIVWLTTDHAWIATVDDVLARGAEEVRTYENRGGAARQKKTWNLSVENARPFAKVIGYRINETLKASFQWTKSGGVEVDVTDDPGDFADVEIATLRSLANAARR